MSTPTPIPAWQQLTLSEPVAVEISLRCGIVPDGHHAQFQLEVRSATDGALLEMSSYPHADLDAAYVAAEQWVDRFRETVFRYSGPF